MSRESPPIPRLVNARCDRLRIAYAGAPVMVRRTRAGNGVIVGGESYRITGQGSALVLAGQGVQVKATSGRVVVVLGAGYLARHALAEAVAHAGDVARALCADGANVGPGEVWDLDLCVDIAGAIFTASDTDRMVGQLRGAGRWRQDIARGAAGSVVTGLVSGNSAALSVTIYDKVRQLRGKGSDMAEVERATWTAYGWDGAATVWRIEFKLRGAVLTQYGLREPAALAGRVDGVWKALTFNTLRLVVRGERTRRDRCPLDPRWQAVQGAKFTAAADVAAVRVRSPQGGSTLPAAVGTVASCLRASGVSCAEAMILIGPIVARVGTPDDADRLQATLDRLWGPAATAPAANDPQNRAPAPDEVAA